MTAVLERPVAPPPANGGVAARRAMLRWAWRLFRQEWRQQLLILVLIVVAVAATFVGAAVSTNTPPPSHAGFGTAHDMAGFAGPDPHLAAQVAALRHRFGQVQVIESQTVPVPGSVNSYNLLAMDPRGPFGGPMLRLLSGHYPTGPGQVAMTGSLAATFHVTVGRTWRQGGVDRRVVGIVENPQSLLDQFALVVPGQVYAPTQITVLFDARHTLLGGPGTGPAVRAAGVNKNVLNPQTIVLAVATVGMLLIGLVAVGGFTVLAQRRLRSIGMLGALGATDRNIGLVVRANGLLVGLTGTVLGGVLGLVAWLAYRPHLETSAHHLIGTFQLPWLVIAPAMALAVLASYLAAARPARAVVRVPVVTALSGRPAAARRVHRSAVPGVAILVGAFVLFSIAGSGAKNGGGGPELVLGLVALVAAVVLLSPVSLVALARLTRQAPVAVRLAVRDLVRYRARSGSALGAISVGVLIAVVICLVAAARYGNVLDYAGPNLGSNQVIATPAVQNGPPGGAATGPAKSPGALAAAARSLAVGLGTHDVVALETTSANLRHAASGRQWNGQVYLATPALLRAFGIKVSQVDPDADILSMRPGLAGISHLQLLYGPDQVTNGGKQNGGPPNADTSYPCPPSACLPNPVIQQVGALPSGTSAPNTVVTEHALHQLDLHPSLAGWLIQTAHPLTATQLSGARLTAAASGLDLETKNDQPSSSEVIDWATLFGIVLALGVLAMSVGLVRSETASDLRTLTATGASSSTRRSLTAATAGSLALLGAVLGTAAGYIAVIGWVHSSALNGGLSALDHVPARNLLVILVGMPLIAAVGGWLLAGREPPVLGRQPLG